MTWIDTSRALSLSPGSHSLLTNALSLNQSPLSHDQCNALSLSINQHTLSESLSESMQSSSLSHDQCNTLSLSINQRPLSLRVSLIINAILLLALSLMINAMLSLS